ncbi:MAG TPA: glycoside hydrolase family 28 protein [Terracidiphilus sp.]|nr:glycoside hydrolase family 28 protein [Terracidiphilus sp.]
MRQSPTSWIALAASAVAFVACMPLRAASVCNPRAFGAKGDGVTKDTAAIQQAIDACESKGGGTVTLPAGTYLSAPIILRSNITLHLDKGATLLGSPDHSDYPPKTEFRAPGLQSLVSATNAEDVTIEGEGTIDGNGESWWQMVRAFKDAGVMGNEHPRPRLVVFDHCRHIRVEGITIQNSPMWQLVPYYSDDVTIRNVKILAPVNSPNTDAVDPFSSSNVTIDHLYADTGDDDIAIKSGAANSPGPDSPSRNIAIADCTFLHGHGLSIGSELAGGISNIRAERIHFDGTDNGIRVKANRDRGNDVSGLVFRDIDMKGVGYALIVSEYYPKMLPPEGTEAPQPVTRLTPHFHDITFENVTVVDSSTAGAIVGLPESPVLGITLRNVKIGAVRGLTIGYAQVAGTHVTVTAQQGPGIIEQAGAKISIH